MKIKEEKGLSGIDITISVLILTLLIAFITNISYQLDKNAKVLQRRTEAMAYAIEEIETIKNKGYLATYEEKGLTQKEIIEQKDIYDEKGELTGYNLQILIEDYISFPGNEKKNKNQLKKITVEISFKIGKQEEKVQLETLVMKEK